VSEQEQAIVPVTDSSWRTRIMLAGGIIGTVLGVLSAYLYVRAAEEAYGGEAPPEAPKTSDAVRLGISLLSIVRTITDWGKR
jgi:hypothetical protein